MSAITGDNLRALVDSIAAQGNLIETHIGDTATNGTVLYGMQQNCGRIDGYGEDAIADLYKAFVGEKSLMPYYMLNLNHEAIKSLEHHLRRLEGVGISDYWEAEQYPTHRIPPKFAQIARTIGFYLKASLVFPTVTAMGSFAVTGAGTGTFTDGSAVDGDLYGPANLELEVTAKGGASVSLVATVIGKDENGAEVTGSGEFVAADVGGKVDVTPDQAGKKFLDVTNITITGGASGDEFKVQSKVDRAVSM
jgi:hypothetical protein